MTPTLVAPPPVRQHGPASVQQRLPRGALALGVVGVWVLLAVLLRDRDTLELGRADLTSLHQRLNDAARSVQGSRGTSPVFAVIDPVRQALDAFVGLLQDVLARPSYGRPVPVLGWLGVASLATYAAWALGNVRVALLTSGGLVLLAAQGLWRESMDTLALTLAAVLVCLVLGVPLGLWAGLSPRVHRALLPLLDLLQTMPTVVYLAPLTLLFLIGPASAVVATVLYAVAPVVRLTALGVRSVPAEVREAAAAIGSTRAQALRKVLLPVARPTVVLGVNQTMMAALAMVTVAALIDAPGLGQSVVQALQTLDVGAASNAGLAIVVLAVVLDRTTTAASRRVRRPSRLRRAALLAGLLAALAGGYLSRTYLWAADPAQLASTGVGGRVAGAADRATGWTTSHLSGVTAGLRDTVSRWLLDPLEALLAGAPWWVVLPALTALAALAGGRAAAAYAGLGLLLVAGTGLWHDAMTTLASTLLASAVVLALGVGLGTWSGRSRRVDTLLRPLLDVGQTLPAFVYLVPFVALFAASRFTAIVAAVIYAAPAVTRIVADGVRGVDRTALDAARALGSTEWQVVRKVQLPMARASLALAANQGVVLVLATVVVGGLVGAGALGYDVVAGFSQGELYGKGLAAGAAVVLLGVVLDRVTQEAARRPRT